jgi:hypothetical protein
VCVVVGDHLNGCVGGISAKEQARLIKVWSDGARVSSVVESLVTLGCGRIVGVEEAMGMHDSEFEGLLLSLMCSRGLRSKDLRRIALGKE